MTADSDERFSVFCQLIIIRSLSAM